MLDKQTPLTFGIDEECYRKIREIKLDYETDTKSKISISKVIEASIDYYYEKLYGDKT